MSVSSLTLPAQLSSSPAPNPTPRRPAGLRLPELLHTTDLIGDAVLRGDYNHLLPEGGLPTDERWFTRIEGSDTVDVWLISWVPERATELHDHGRSLGALTVLSGALLELHWADGRLHRQQLDAGDQAAFRSGWVHDVVWASPQAGAATVASAPSVPTLSVHAYSPPLVEMSYYEADESSGVLHHRRTELTDQPEAETAS